MPEWKTRRQIAGVENAVVENVTHQNPCAGNAIVVECDRLM